MSLIENQDFIQHFFTNSSDKSFSEGIGIGGSIRDANDIDAFRLENSVKRVGEFLVIIANQSAEFIILFLDSPDLISRLLGDPVAVGMVGDAGQVDLPGADVDEKEDGQVLSQMGST